MKKLITILALIAALSASAITFEEASDIVIYDVLGGDYEGIRVSGREVPIKAGTEIQTVYEETVAFEDTGYLFIINPRPLSIPDGDYRWVLVSLEGEITIYENMLQPLYEASVKTEVIADGIPDYEAEWAEQLERLRLKGDKNPLLRGGVLNVPDLPGEHRALLINGGYNELPLEDWPNMVNLESFWQHLAGGYRTLTQTYGWDTSELEVLSDNGDVPEGDNRWNDPGYSSPPWPAPLDLDDDGLPDYDKPADRDTIEIELDALGRSTSHFDEDDVIFIFISDHGDYWRLPLPPDNWHAKFGTWHGEFYRLPPEGGDMFHDDLFADYLRGFTEDSIKVVFMGTCHSGGFKDDLDSPDLNNVILSTAAPHDGIGTTGYLKDIISALNGAIFGFWCVGGDPIPVDADYNNDGYVSIRETHDWTKDPDGGNYTIEMYWLDNQGLGEIVTLAGVLPTSLRIDGISHQEETISPINPADGDGLYEVGEVIQVFATVENQSPNIAENVLLSLSELDPYASGDIEILVGEILLGDIPPNHSKTNEYALRFRVTEELDRNRRADLILTATETSNYSCYEEFEVALCFDPSVSGFFDDLELPMEGWEFDPGVLPEDRQWHLSDLTYHSADHAWRFGNEELDGYTPIEESLYSPLVFLFPNPQFENKLELFHKFSLRPSMLSAGDGMVIEIFTNEYGWKNLFSVHDYSGYSAVDPDWESYSLDFDDPSYSQYLNNLVQIKFHFIPDSTASGDCYGYDVDDIHLGHWTTKGGIYNFLALYENGKVNVGWSCNSGDVTGFNLYRRETGSTENEALTDTESKNGNEAAELNEGETSLSKSGTDKDKALLDPVSPTIDVDEGWTLLNDKAMALSDSNRYVDADVKPDTKYEYKLEALATGGNVEAITTGVTTAEGNVPFSYHLAQSYPNPTGTAANIDFAIPQTENVTLKIYDIKGRCVATPVDGEMPVGIHSVEVDVSSLANGVYIYSLETPGFSKAMKMVVK